MFSCRWYEIARWRNAGYVFAHVLAAGRAFVEEKMKMVDVREDRCFAASHAKEFFWLANVLLSATDVVGVRVGWMWTSAFSTLMLRRYGIVSWSMVLGLLRLDDTYGLAFTGYGIVSSSIILGSLHAAWFSHATACWRTLYAFTKLHHTLTSGEPRSLSIRMIAKATARGYLENVKTVTRIIV